MKTAIKTPEKKSFQLLIITALLLILIAGQTAFSKTIYVKEGASGTGVSWVDAYGLLQDALDDAGSGDDIWVSAGIYMPTTEVGGSGSRHQSFQMKNGVAIYGGFAGTETLFDQRDVLNNATILSGDIGVPIDPNDNCFHIFYHPDGLALDPNAILDGFTITAGNADGPGDLDGGGMYNGNSNPTVANSTFSGNSAANYGGGMYNYGSNPMVTDCNFIGNLADYGGGIYTTISLTMTDCILNNNSANGEMAAGGGIYATAILTMNDCTLIDNSANGEMADGGGIYTTASLTMTDCTLGDNTANGDTAAGGGIYTTASLTMTDCTLMSDNSANGEIAAGGGIYTTAILTMTDCTLGDNVANGEMPDGGGMAYGGGIYTTASLTMTNCTLIDNLAKGDTATGGGIYTTAILTMTNCTLSDNTAKSDMAEGGGIYTAANLTMTNCTLSDNSAKGDMAAGGGIYNYEEGIVTVSNSILWENTASFDGSEIYNDVNTVAVISYSDISGSDGSGGGWDGTLGTDGGGNIDVDPLFVNPKGIDGISGTIDDNLRLMSGSPCIDAGDNTAVPAGITTDINGFVRFIDDICTTDTGNGTPPIVDMGAYEFLRSDIDSNGDVNLKDFSQFASYWMDIACGVCGGADLTCDGDVNGDDLAAFAGNWLEGASKEN